MDDNYKYFLQNLGPAYDRQDVPELSLERYADKLPGQLLSYWETYGWCGYCDGLFWTVNPQDYEPVVRAWIGNTVFMEQDSYHIIARSAFGDIYFWGEQTGFSLEISALGSFAVPHAAPIAPLDQEVQWFFGGMTRKSLDFDTYFNPARKRLGRLKFDEMYGFVPAIAAGGSSELKDLQKLKIVEHLVYLAQLTDLQVMVTGRS